MGEAGRVLAGLQGGGQALLDRGPSAASEVGLELIDPLMLLLGGGRGDLVLLLGPGELVLALLFGLLPVGPGLVVGQPALLPAGREPFLGAGHQPGEPGQRLGLERLGVRHRERGGEGAWLELRQRNLHGREIHRDGMGERPGQQLLQRSDAVVEFLVEPGRLLLARLVEEAFLLAFPGALLRR